MNNANACVLKFAILCVILETKERRCKKHVTIVSFVCYLKQVQVCYCWFYTTCSDSSIESNILSYIFNVYEVKSLS